MRRILSLIGVLVLWAIWPAAAQEYSGRRVRTFRLHADTLKIDTLSLIPGSVNLVDSLGTCIDPALYEVDFMKALLVVKRPGALSKHSCVITYKVFPYDFTRTFSHKEMPEPYPSLTGSLKPQTFSYRPVAADPFKWEGLNKNGGISRGLSFGNKQDVVVSSNFDLQLSGKLSNDIEILAVATDNNIPVQPEGNTRQVQDFDKVFIQLTRKHTRLIAGDFEIRRPAGYFMNFYKKARGVYVTATLPELPAEKNKAEWDLGASVSVSKGRFTRNYIQAVEGNQGPYRMKGAENETFIIVLAGTEKVYVDGIQLTRGEDNDYTINYNTAELTFTPRVMITKDKRIIVEFEYSDKNFSRSLIFAGTGLKGVAGREHKREYTLRMNLFSEQDMKNQPLQQQLSASDKLLLLRIGDSLGKAYVPAVDSVDFSNDQVLYRKTDTLVDGVLYDSVYVYSTYPGQAFYRLGFTELGQGKGDYILVPGAANGRVFKWLAPVNHIHQGAFQPVILLVTPKKTQMLTVGGEIGLGRNGRASLEVAFSNHNQNTFSTLNKSDDRGFALKLLLDRRAPVFRSGTGQERWLLGTGLSMEMTSAHFSPLGPFRAVEFERDWNIQAGGLPGSQVLPSLSVSLVREEKVSLDYKLTSFFSGSDYRAVRNLLSGRLAARGFDLRFASSLLGTAGDLSRTRYLKHNIQLSKKIKGVMLGMSEETENDQVRDKASDTLATVSFAFTEWGFFAMNADTGKFRIKAFHKERKDDRALLNSFRNVTRSREDGLTAETGGRQDQTTRLTLTYRELSIGDSLLAQLKPDHTLVGRAENFARLFKGAVVSNTFYEIGSGTELKKEYSYLKVGNGQGTYVWNDYNGDNIPQLNEFEVAAFREEANYIRILVPTKDYVKTWTNQFSQSLDLFPALAWSREKGIRKMLARFSDQLSYRIAHKTTGDNPGKAFDPFMAQIADSMLVSMGAAFRNALMFNRNDPKFAADLVFSNHRSKTLLTNGFDAVTLISRTMNLRWNFTEGFTFYLVAENGTKRSLSGFFPDRNYDIRYQWLSPRLTYQPGAIFRLSVFMQFSGKKNHEEAQGQSASSWKTGAEFDYKVASKGGLSAKAHITTVRYDGMENNALSYEMLEGLAKGTNLVWELSYQRNLSDHLQVNLIYDGRKSPGLNMVNTGNIQLRAFF